MAFDYPTLTAAAKTTAGSVRSWTNNNTVPATDVVADTEDWLAGSMRVRGMQARADLTIAIGDSEIDLTVDLPNFLDPIRLHMKGYGDLTLVPEDDIDRLRAAEDDGTLSSSTPSYWTTIGQKILFDCKANIAYNFVLTHYARPEALSAINTTNLFTQEWKTAFKYAAMGFSYVFLKDEDRAGKMFSLAQQAINQGLVTDDLVRRGMRFDVTVDE